VKESVLFDPGAMLKICTTTPLHSSDDPV